LDYCGQPAITTQNSYRVYNGMARNTCDSLEVNPMERDHSNVLISENEMVNPASAQHVKHDPAESKRKTAQDERQEVRVRVKVYSMEIYDMSDNKSMENGRQQDGICVKMNFFVEASWTDLYAKGRKRVLERRSNAEACWLKEKQGQAEEKIQAPGLKLKNCVEKCPDWRERYKIYSQDECGRPYNQKIPAIVCYRITGTGIFSMGQLQFDRPMSHGRGSPQKTKMDFVELLQIETKKKLEIRT